MSISTGPASCCRDCVGTQPLAPCSWRVAAETGAAVGISQLNSLAGLPIGLAKILVEAGRVSFRASGLCMYPCVKPGDTLYLDSKGIAEVAVGDIAVLRRDRVLLGHRVTRCGADVRGRFIVTKSDLARQGDDGRSREEDVMGIISSISRNGRPVSTRLREPTAWTRLEVVFLEAAYRARHHWEQTLAWLLSGARRTNLLDFAARNLLRVSDKDVSYSYQIPHRLGRSILYQSVSAAELELALSKEAAEKVDHWTLTVHSGKDREPCGSATFVLRHEKCPLAGWWLGNLRTRFRYRCSGLEGALLTSAEAVLVNCAVAELKVSASERAAVDRFESLGFQKVEGPGDQCTLVRRFLDRSGVGVEMRANTEGETHSGERTSREGVWT